jgi:RND family efflux transporter MFP subunit
MMSLLKKKWFWLVILVVGFGGWKYYQSMNTPPAYQTATVERGTVVQTVSASATLLADAEIRLNFEMGGRVRDIATSVGKQVSDGDVIARLDVATLTAEISRAQAALDQAEAAAGLSDEALREARDGTKNAKDYLSSVEDAQDQAVEAADAAYSNAQDYESQAQSYYDQVASDHGSSGAEAKSAKLTLIAATNARKAADQARESARRNRDVAVQQADNTYQTNKQKVKTLESKSQTLSTDSAVLAARAAYDIALRNLDKAQIKAPISGTITKVNYKKGEVIGTATGDFGALLSLDTVLEAKVPESDITKIALGQEATLSLDAFPSSETLRAQVIEIEPASTVIQDVVYYKVKLKLLTPDKRLKPGMTGDVDIHIANKDNVLFLPSRAIKKDGKNPYVEVSVGPSATLERRPVTLGLEGDESRVEIVSGVPEGQVVVIGLSK